MARPILPLNALRAFEASARHRSFTKAALELNVTQAAISHHVKALEERLGAKLFHRSPRGLMLSDEGVALVGIEAAGEGVDSGRHAATLTLGKPGVLHGCLSYLLQDGHGQVAPAHSVSAGLDYPGVGPEHSFLKDSGRATYTSVTDAEALDAFQRLARLEGIIPALESAHAIAWLLREGAAWEGKGPVVVCLSGRGDKDVAQVAELTG